MKKIFLLLPLLLFLLIGCSAEKKTPTEAVQTEKEMARKPVGEALIHQIPGRFSIDQAREISVYFVQECLKVINAKADQEILPENIVAILIFTDPLKQTDFAPYPHPAACVIRNGVISFDTFKWKNINQGMRDIYAHLYPWGIKPYEALESSYVEAFEIAAKITSSLEEEFPKESIDFYTKQLNEVLKWKSIHQLELHF